MNKQTLSVKECAELLGVGENTIRKAIARGDIPHVRIGRRVLIPMIAIVKMLDPSIGAGSEK